MTVRVYKFGCANQRWDLPAHAREQLRLAHEFRNDLVRAEHAHENEVDAVWRTVPDVAAALDRRDHAEQALQDAIEIQKDERRQARSTDIDPVPELTTAKATLAAARDQVRQLKDQHLPGLRPRFRDLLTGRKTAVNDARTRWRNAGLHWGTLDDVTARHETACKRVAEQRKQGKPAQLRLRPWRGEGTLTVQLMRHAWKHGCGGKKPPWPCGNKTPGDCPDRTEQDPPRSPALLAGGGGRWANVFQLGPWIPADEWAAMSRAERRRAGAAPPKGGSWCRIGLGRDLPPIELPVVVDRMMPADADVAFVQVTRRMVADRPQVTLAVTCRLPDPEPAAGPAVGVHLGWRALPDGDLRVGVVTADGPLSPPPDHLPVHRVGHGWEIRLPESLRHAHLRTEKVTAARGIELERFRDLLAGWLDGHGPVPHPARPEEELTAAAVRQWRSPARFASLVKAWQRAQAPTVPADVLDAAAAWLKQDIHLWRWEANERSNTSDTVTHLWRNIAAWLGRQAGRLVVDDTRINDLARVAPVEEEDSYQARASRVQQRAAQPGGLRDAAVNACGREGVEIVKVSAKGVTSTHAACGHGLVGEPESEVILWCSSCGRGVDQDLNASQHLIAHAEDPT